jgi:hypothetical protein
MFKGMLSGFVIWITLVSLGVIVAVGHLLPFLVAGAVLGLLLID